MWGVPLDDPTINQLHTAQLSLYDWLLVKDSEREADDWRDRLEYIAMFINGEAVQKIQRMRKQRKLVSDSEFNQVLEKEFGRALPRSPEAAAREQIAEAEENGELDKIRVINKNGEVEVLESSFSKKVDPNDFVRK